MGDSGGIIDGDEECGVAVAAVGPGRLDRPGPRMRRSSAWKRAQAAAYSGEGSGMGIGWRVTGDGSMRRSAVKRGLVAELDVDEAGGRGYRRDR